MLAWADIVSELNHATRLIREKTIVIDAISTPKCWSLLTRRTESLVQKKHLDLTDREAHKLLWRAYLADALRRDDDFAEWVAVVE